MDNPFDSQEWENLKDAASEIDWKMAAKFALVQVGIGIIIGRWSKR